MLQRRANAVTVLWFGRVSCVAAVGAACALAASAAVAAGTRTVSDGVLRLQVPSRWSASIGPGTQAGQPVAWLVLTLGLWVVSTSVGMTMLAYALSWALATAAGWWVWLRETRGFEPMPAEPGETRALLRYGAPRAPAQDPPSRTR